MLTEATAGLIRDVYRHVLGIDEIGPGEEFLGGLGGDSLSLADAVAMLFQLLGVDVMDAMSANSSAEAVAAYVERALRATATKPRRLPAPGPVPAGLVESAARVLDLAGVPATQPA